MIVSNRPVLHASHLAPAPPAAPSAAAPAPPGPGLPAWMAGLEGLEAAAASFGKDLGELLTSEQKRGLESVLVGLEQKGVRFRMPAQGFFTRGDARPVAARQVLPALAGARPHYLGGLQLEAPGHAPLKDLGLAGLAAACQFLAGPDDLLKQALAGLAAQGYGEDPLKAYTSALGSGNLSIQFERNGKLETYVASSLDEVLAANALAGDGSLRGLEHPDRARRLVRAVQAGWLDRGGALHVYRDARGRVPLTFDSKIPPLKVQEEAMDDPATLGAVGRRYRDAYARYVLPSVTASGYSSTYAFHDEVHTPEGRASLEARLESLGLLMAECDHLGGTELRDLHQELCRRNPSSLDLVSAARRVAPSLRAKGPAAALASLDDLLRVGPSPRSALYDDLLGATGSHEAARGGVDLVRIPVVRVPAEGAPAAEALQARLEAFQSLAAALPEDHRGLAPEVYQQLLILKRPEEPLATASANLRGLLVGCAAAGFPMLAPALYEVLQKSPPEAVERKVADFGKTLAAGATLAGALDRLEAAEAGEIRVEADRITIGGIVIPRRG